MTIGCSKISSVEVHPRFLSMLGAPPKTSDLSFRIEVGGRLWCRAVYHTDMGDETAVKEWELTLPRNSLFYKLITNGGIQ